jgi:xylulokinase
VIQSDLTVVSEAKVDFDGDFGAKYGLKKGVLLNESEGEVYAPVALWLEALDLVLARLKEKNCPLDRIRGISGSCQQHGSVYWSREAERLLSSLDSNGELVKQLAPEAFSYEFSPNWQDHSTQKECDAFEASVGGAERLAQVTGSAAHHRFTGPQIMRLKQTLPDMYASTKRISLVSSFLASVLMGKIAPMDISDVCGMNLWDVHENKWSEPLLELTAGGKEGVEELKSKLGDVRQDGGGGMGAVCGYFVSRYGFSPECQVAPFTGDNPGTILALPLRPLDAIVSLGTSSTFLMVTPVYKPDASYHFFNHPTTPGHYMFMLCYKNGGLAREKVRDTLPAPSSGDPWANFNQSVLSIPPLDIAKPDDRAKIGLYFPLPEIVPNVRSGTWRYTVSPGGGDLQESEAWGAEKDARAIVESQALSMRLRSQKLVSAPKGSKLPAQPRRIYLVGGGSLNSAIAKVMGDVLGGVDGVYRLDVGGNACALGGAYKAVWAFERADGETFDELIGKRWKEEGAISRVDDGYKEGVFEKYGSVLGAFEKMEAEILKVAKNT